jgi:hypothetical protein
MGIASSTACGSPLAAARIRAQAQADRVDAWDSSGEFRLNDDAGSLDCLGPGFVIVTPRDPDQGGQSGLVLPDNKPIQAASRPHSPSGKAPPTSG